MDICSQLDVIAHRSELQRSGEVLLSKLVVAGVVRHPAGHLCKRSGATESVLAAVDEAGCDLVLQVADDGSVQVAAPNPAVSLAERLHGALDVVAACCGAGLDRILRRVDSAARYFRRSDAMRCFNNPGWDLDCPSLPRAHSRR